MSYAHILDLSLSSKMYEMDYNIIYLIKKNNFKNVIYKIKNEIINFVSNYKKAIIFFIIKNKFYYLIL